MHQNIAQLHELPRKLFPCTSAGTHVMLPELHSLTCPRVQMPQFHNSALLRCRGLWMQQAAAAPTGLWTPLGCAMDMTPLGPSTSLRPWLHRTQRLLRLPLPASWASQARHSAVLPCEPLVHDSSMQGPIGCRHLREQNLSRQASCK